MKSEKIVADELWLAYEGIRNFSDPNDGTCDEDILKIKFAGEDAVRLTGKAAINTQLLLAQVHDGFAACRYVVEDVFREEVFSE